MDYIRGIILSIKPDNGRLIAEVCGVKSWDRKDQSLQYCVHDITDLNPTPQLNDAISIKRTV